jgi:hypothetical protein
MRRTAFLTRRTASVRPAAPGRATAPGARTAPARRARPAARALSVVAAVTLLALAAFPGPAVADGGGAAADPAGTTWQPQGRPLAGTATTADAPAMRPSVTYRDTIKPGESRFYGIVLDATVSAAVSVFAVPPAGTRTGFGDGIDLTLQSASGDDCDRAQVRFQDDGDDRPIGTAVSRLITGNSLDPCQDANQYTVEVHRTSDGTSDPGAWPLELRYVAEPGLMAAGGTDTGGTGTTAGTGTAGSGNGGGAAAVGGAAGVGSPPALPTATASPTPLTSGTAHRVTGGPSFATAAAIRTGIWTDAIAPGRTRFYKVPVDWGRQLTVFADFASAVAPSGGSTPFIASGVRLTVYSPVRERIDGDDKAYLGRPVALGEQFVPVAYANRASTDDHVKPVRYAGWYYLAVTVHPDVTRAVHGALPVTLRVAVSGTAHAGPRYDGDPAAAGIGVTAADTLASGAGAGAGHPSSPALRFTGFAALGAGAVLLLALAAWSAAARLDPRSGLRRGRRARRVEGRSAGPPRRPGS